MARAVNRENVMQIQGTTALVTGANRGIGRALALALVRAGASKVYAAARDVARLAPLVAEGDGRIIPLALDVTSPTQIADAARAASDVTLLFNNAGVWDSGSFLDSAAQAIERDLAVNYLGTLAVARAFAPTLIARPGAALINVLSVVSLATMPALGGYSASKAAAWAMTQGLRAELTPRGVAVFAVFPGPVDTDMTRNVPMDKTSPSEVATAILDGVVRDTLDIYPDPMSKQVHATWAHDPSGLVQQFAAM